MYVCVCVCVQQFLSWASHRCAWHWLKFLSRGQSVLTVELSARRLLFLHGWMKFLLKWRLSAVTRLSRPSVSGSSCEEIFWEMLCLKEEKMLRRWIVIFFLKTERWCHTPAGFMFSESGQTWGQNMLKKKPPKNQMCLPKTFHWSFLTHVLFTVETPSTGLRFLLHLTSKLRNFEIITWFQRNFLEVIKVQRKLQATKKKKRCSCSTTLLFLLPSGSDTWFWLSSYKQCVGGKWPHM